MRIICLIKYIPDVDNFKYDYEKNTLVRENVDLILNPDDANALAYALKMKEANSNINIEVVSMGPLGISEFLKNLLRMGVDKATLLSDAMFGGSDTYATSIIISEYLKKTDYDIIFTGTHTLDGSTAHISPQVAEVLKLNQYSNIINIHGIDEDKVTFDADMEQTIVTIEMKLPAVLSISKEINYKLGFVKYANLNLNVDDKLFVISNNDLQINAGIIGFKGSPTKVKKTFARKYEKTDKKVVKNDNAGIEVVYQFLKEKGLIRDV